MEYNPASIRRQFSGHCGANIFRHKRATIIYGDIAEIKLRKTGGISLIIVPCGNGNRKTSFQHAAGKLNRIIFCTRILAIYDNIIHGDAKLASNRRLIGLGNSGIGSERNPVHALPVRKIPAIGHLAIYDNAVVAAPKVNIHLGDVQGHAVFSNNLHSIGAHASTHGDGIVACAHFDVVIRQIGTNQIEHGASSVIVHEGCCKLAVAHLCGVHINVLSFRSQGRGCLEVNMPVTSRSKAGNLAQITALYRQGRIAAGIQREISHIVSIHSAVEFHLIGLAHILGSNRKTACIEFKISGKIIGSTAFAIANSQAYVADVRDCEVGAV